jgi:hypothetical protein
LTFLKQRPGVWFLADRSSEKENIKLSLFDKLICIIVYLYTTKVWDDFCGHLRIIRHAGLRHLGLCQGAIGGSAFQRYIVNIT